MIFWILLALVIGVTLFVGIAVYREYDSIGAAIGGGIFAAAMAGIVAFIVILLFMIIPSTSHEKYTYHLRALATSQSVQGEFFLGSGSVNGERTLNYIKRVKGWSEVDSAVAKASRVFEDSTSPTVTEYFYYYDNGWVLPWKILTGYSWDFHVPAGSILEDTTIDNGGTK